jgi:predicted RNA-binding Zn-ribbon protein involved in translation (DUF1610 family)
VFAVSSDTKYSTSRKPLPFDPGERVLVCDAEPEEAIVVEQLVERIDEYVIDENDDGTTWTVDDYHRGQYPSDDNVVICVFEQDIEEMLDTLERDLVLERVLDVFRLLEVSPYRQPVRLADRNVGVPQRAPRAEGSVMPERYIHPEEGMVFACPKCGEARQGRLCRDCERMEHQEAYYGTPDDHVDDQEGSE